MTTILVGTQQGLCQVVLESSDARPQTRKWTLRGEWITSASVSRAATPQETFLTTRSGKLLRLDRTGTELLLEVPFRLWFSHQRPDGTLVTGGTAYSLMTREANGTAVAESLDGLATSESWKSHSGSTAHVCTYLTAPSGKEYLGVEVGGVYSRTNGSLWQRTCDIDPDVHALATSDGQSLFAATGSGVYQLQDAEPRWRRLTSPPLTYVQGVVYSGVDSSLYCSASATPFGRRHSGPYVGTSPHNTFGVFRLSSEQMIWRALDCTDRPLGVLSKALEIGVDQRLYVGDLGGHLYVCNDGRSLHLISDGLGAIECVTTLPDPVW